MNHPIADSDPSPGFVKIKRRRVFEDICDQIRRKLARGEYKPGDKLPSERDLATEFGVGRPAVREALRTLENAGILLHKKGLKGGAFVREGNPEFFTQSLHDLVNLGHIELTDLIEARIVLTRSIVRMACERGTEAEFDAIERNIAMSERLEVNGDYADRVTTGAEFFRLIAEAAHNGVLMLLVDSLTAITRFVLYQSRPASSAQIERRRQILACLRARDAERARLHLNVFFQEVEDTMARANVLVTPPAADRAVAAG